MMGVRSESCDESGGAVAAADSAHLGVRDPALPADGRRHHFPGRLRLHAGDAGACWAIFYGLIFAVSNAGDLSGTAMVALILIAAFVFQPIRNWIQEQLDRYYFYKDRYDYRRTLIEFARELGSPTDLGEMLESVADRLIRTLGIRHVAFFVWDEARSRNSIWSWPATATASRRKTFPTVWI